MAEKSSFMGEKIEFQGKKSSFKHFGKIEFPSKRTKKSLKPVAMSDILTFDIIEFVRVWVVDVYAQDFPVRLSIVDHGQDSQDFDLDDRPPGMNSPTYLDHVNRVVVTTNASAAINVARVLPSL